MNRALSSSLPDPPSALSLSLRLVLLLLLPLPIVLLLPLSFLLLLLVILPLLRVIPLSIWTYHNRRRRHSPHNRQQPKARQTARNIRGLRR